jgi:putative hemolysin
MAITIAAVSLLAFTGGCSDDDNDDPGLPNPAAVFCEQQGGTTSGPEPMCELPDGSVIDAWDYYRAEGLGD